MLIVDAQQSRMQAQYQHTHMFMFTATQSFLRCDTQPVRTHTHTHTHGTESSRLHTTIRTSLDDNGLHRTTTRTASEPPARFSLFDAMTAFAAFSIFHTRSFAFPPRARRFPHHTRKPEYTRLASNRRLNLGRVFREYEFSSLPKRSLHLTAPPSPTDNAAMPLSMPSSLFRPCTELVGFLWFWASRGLAVLE